MNMNGQEVGYIRVSSVGQKTDRQLEGIDLDEIFIDKASGATTKRPQLAACLKHLRRHDTLHVHSIDRIARNLADLKGLVEGLTKRGVDVIFHKESLKFTSANQDPMQKLMLHVIGAVSEFERSLIRERQAEGIAAAKKKGKKFGVQPKLTPAQVREASAMVSSKKFNKSEVASHFGISRPTLYKYLNANAGNEE